MSIPITASNLASSSSHYSTIIPWLKWLTELPENFSTIVGKLIALHSLASSLEYPQDFLYEVWQEIGRLRIWGHHLEKIRYGEVPLHTLETLRGLIEEIDTYLTYGVNSVRRAPAERLAIGQKAEVDDSAGVEVDVDDIHVDDLDPAEVLQDISDVITSLYMLGPALSLHSDKLVPSAAQHTTTKPVEQATVSPVDEVTASRAEKITVKPSNRRGKETKTDEKLKEEAYVPTCGYCNQANYGEMIVCSNNDCSERFHLSCTGLAGPPGSNGKDKWYCNVCREELNDDLFSLSISDSPAVGRLYADLVAPLRDEGNAGTEDATTVSNMPTSSSLPGTKTPSGAVKLVEGSEVGLSFKTDDVIKCFRLYKGKLLQVSL